MTDRRPLDIPSFAESGPAFSQLAQQGPIDWTQWQRAARTLEFNLGGAADLDRRIHHLYLPVLFFCLARLRASDQRPLVVGLQAPQGGGKTTLTTNLLQLLPEFGVRATAISVDDFYLTRPEQLALAAAHPGNPYLEHRGYPGTHDVALGEATLVSLRGLNARSPALKDRPPGVLVPVYDKSAHAGRGDRAPESAWRHVAPPLDLVLLEGWMLGFAPVPESTLPDPRLAPPNRALADYDRWHRELDAFVVLRAKDPNDVLKWRVEAEEAMKAAGKPGLSREAIEDYIRRFLPAYALYGGAPQRFAPAETMTVTLDGYRRPIEN